MHRGTLNSGKSHLLSSTATSLQINMSLIFSDLDQAIKEERFKLTTLRHSWPVWPNKNRQISIKVAQIWFH